MSSLFRKKGASAPAASGLPPVGAEHEACFPLLCQMGDDGNRYLESLLPGKAQIEYLKIIYYLAGKGLVDQFLLGKAYLGLMMVEAQRPSGTMRELVDGPPPGLPGVLREPVALLSKPAHHVFKSKMLSATDQDLYERLCRFGRGEADRPAGSMSPWELKRVRAESFAVLHVPSSSVALILNPKSPPLLRPEYQGMELDIAIPDLDQG